MKSKHDIRGEARAARRRERRELRTAPFCLGKLLDADLGHCICNYKPMPWIRDGQVFVIAHNGSSTMIRLG